MLNKINISYDRILLTAFMANNCLYKIVIYSMKIYKIIIKYIRIYFINIYG